MDCEENKSFPCEFCEETFDSQSNLMLHIGSVHENARQFQCLKSFKEFSSKRRRLRDTSIRMLRSENSKLTTITSTKLPRAARNTKSKLIVDLTQKRF